MRHIETSDNSEREPEELDEKQQNLKAIVSAMTDKSVHQLRSAGTVEQYKMYCELCYPSIVGKYMWKMNHSRVGIKTLLTAADEAIVALVLENNISEWIYLAEGNELEGRKRMTLYTHGGKNGSETRKGWSLEGRQRYNKIYSELKEIRNKPGTTRMDEQMKQMWLNELNAQNISAAANSTVDENAHDRDEQTFEPAFDFDD